MVDFVRFTSLLVLHICDYLGHSALLQLSLFLDLFFAFWSLIVGMTEDSHYFSWEEMMRPHTLWTRILDTSWTPAIFPSIFRRISNRYSIISIFPGLSRLLDVRAISHVDCTATATYYQSHCSMLHLYSILPTFGLSYHWRLRYFRLYHMAIAIIVMHY
jgi:hypothetical protein